MKLTRRVLQNRAKPVDFRYPLRNQIMAQRLQDFMIQQRAIGLSANQVGINQRVFVMKVADRLRWCFNPEILEWSDSSVEFDEGCLSFPGDQCTITRPAEITVRYQNAQGDWSEERLQDLEARCFQHELDHLNGITMWDRHKEQNAE